MEGFIKPLPGLRRRLALAIALTLLALPAAAGSLEQAKRMHDRLAGVPPSAAILDQMQRAINNDGACGITLTGGCTPEGAAYLAMSNKAFYNATLKNWITPWTNRDGNKFAPLNDYTATVIGVVRDELDYRWILWDDILYVPSNTFGAYSNSNNNAYVALESADADMGSSAVLAKQTQSAVTGLRSDATSGVITSRAAARAFFIDGTNRAMFRFTLKNHLCNDMEQVQDITRPSDRIRRDIPRSPGGDSRIFMNTCIGCHSGMDPLAQAFAFYDFHYDKTAANAAQNPDTFKDAGYLTYQAAADVAHDPADLDKTASPAKTDSKYHINETHFSEGYETLDDRWDNYWRSGPNTAIFGWAMTGPGSSGTGIGAPSMLKELAYSELFASCSVKKVFQAVCLRAPAVADQSAFNGMLTNFKTNNYNLKHTFAEAAVYCSGN